jgi:hypothetical protein
VIYRILKKIINTENSKLNIHHMPVLKIMLYFRFSIGKKN